MKKLLTYIKLHLDDISLQTAGTAEQSTIENCTQMIHVNIADWKKTLKLDNNNWSLSTMKENSLQNSKS